MNKIIVRSIPYWLCKYLFIGEVELNVPEEGLVQLAVALVPRTVVVVGDGVEVTAEVEAGAEGGVPSAQATPKINLRNQ